MLQIVSLLHQSKTISSVRSFFPPDLRFSNAILQHVAKNREMQTVLSMRSVSPLHSALPLELMELPLDCFSPQMGTAGGDPPPRAGATPFPTLTPSTPCLLLLLLLCCATARLQPSACCTVLALSGRGGVHGSSRRGRTTVMMSQAHICPQRRAEGRRSELSPHGSPFPPLLTPTSRRPGDRRGQITWPSNEANEAGYLCRTEGGGWVVGLLTCLCGAALWARSALHLSDILHSLGEKAGKKVLCHKNITAVL